MMTLETTRKPTTVIILQENNTCSLCSVDKPLCNILNTGRINHLNFSRTERMAFMFHVMATFLYTENGPAEGSKHQLKILFLNVVRSFVAKNVSVM